MKGLSLDSTEHCSQTKQVFMREMLYVTIHVLKMKVSVIMVIPDSYVLPERTTSIRIKLVVMKDHVFTTCS